MIFLYAGPHSPAVIDYIKIATKSRHNRNYHLHCGILVLRLIVKVMRMLYKPRTLPGSDTSERRFPGWLTKSRAANEICAQPLTNHGLIRKKHRRKRVHFVAVMDARLSVAARCVRRQGKRLPVAYKNTAKQRSFGIFLDRGFLTDQFSSFVVFLHNVFLH